MLVLSARAKYYINGIYMEGDHIHSFASGDCLELFLSMTACFSLGRRDSSPDRHGQASPDQEDCAQASERRNSFTRKAEFFASVQEAGPGPQPAADVVVAEPLDCLQAVVETNK